jgi:hypothetical protein
MGVSANQRVGTVLDCQESKTRVAQSIGDFTNINNLIMSSNDMLGNNYYYDLLDMYETMYIDDIYMTDSYCPSWDVYPYSILAENNVITSMARMHTIQRRASQSFDLTNTRWYVDDVSDGVFRPLYRLTKSEFWEIFNHLSLSSFPCALANYSRCTLEVFFMVWLRRMGSRAPWLEIASDLNFQFARRQGYV